MAISLSKIKQRAAQRKSAKDVAAQQQAQFAKEGKRKKWSGILGKAGGALLGAAAVGLTGLTGGLAAPLVMGAAASLGKKWADEGTKRGVFGAGLKGGDPSKIHGDQYGYGKEEAERYRSALSESRHTEFSGQTMLGDIASSYLSAGMSGKLGGAKALLKGGEGAPTFGQALTGSKDWAGSMAKGDIGGWGGVKSELSNLISFKDEGGNEIAQDFDQSGFDYTTDYGGQTDEIISPEFDEEGWSITGEQGGRVPQLDQNTLLGLAILSQMQNGEKAYDNTPLEEVKQPSISEYFASKGKTLGGSNKQSLSQQLGR